MDLQSKLETIFRNLIEKDARFGRNSKFISLSVNNLDGTEASDDNSAKIYLGVLKFYDVTSNVFKSVSLFVKIQPQGKKHNGSECGHDGIKYDFKFHNEYVAYKHVLPFLDQSFANRTEEAFSPFNQVGSKRFRSNEDKENAYTIEEFPNEIRYKEIGKVDKKQHRHSWNHLTYEREKAEVKFYTIKPNSTFALDKCAKYYDSQMEQDAMRRQAHDGILKFFPEYYHGEMNKNLDANIIVIENMLPAGFHTSNEAIFLDKERILLTLRTLGKFHASSYIAKHKDAAQFNKVVNMLRATGWTLPDYWDIYPDFLNEHLLRGVECLRNDKKYAGQLYKFDFMLKNPKERFFKLLQVDEKIAVICHGDFCKNNILYKYEPKDAELDNSEPSSFDMHEKSKESNTLNWEILAKKKKIADTVCVETYKIENQKEMLPKENFTNQFRALKHDTHLKESRSISQAGSKFCETKGFHRPKYDAIGSYRLHMDFLEKVAANRVYEDQKKENKMKQNFNTISKKRKEFLDDILDRNSKPFVDTRELHSSMGSVVNKSNSSLLTKNAATKLKELTYPTNRTITIEPLITPSKNTSITRLDCVPNKGFGITNDLNSGEESIINLNKKTREIIPFTEFQIENSTKRSVRHETEQVSSVSRLTESNTIISDRLQYLEEKYKQLEEIYNANKCALERKVVNMKIIEKLNEKKQILEEICKKIEKISRKQEMESRLHCSVNRLCQNIDDSETKRILKSSLPNYSTTIDQKKTHTIKNKDPTQEEAINIAQEQNNANRTNNTHSVKKTSRMSYMKHTINQTTKSVDDEFNQIYEQTFPHEIDSSYEKLFNELSRKVSASVDENQDEHLKNVNQSNSVNRTCKRGCKISSINTKSANTTREMNTQSHYVNTAHSSSNNTIDSEYKTLSVKERRENLERSISLSNELKSFDKKQTTTKENHKIIKRSNSDVNQIQLNSVLVSERNILLNDEFRDGASEKAAIIKDFAKGLQTKTKPRIFTDSSWSINEYEELSFTNDCYTRETNSILCKQRDKSDLTRSQSHADLKGLKPKPVPMKRTISQVTDSNDNLNYETEKANKENIGSNYIYNSSRCRTRDSFANKTHFILGSDDENKKQHETSKESQSYQYFAGFVPWRSSDKRTDKEQSCRISSGQPPETDKKLVEFENPKGRIPEAMSSSSNEAQRVLSNAQVTSGHPRLLVPEIIFFDLARMVYASPVIDLSFFLFLNVSHELRASCWDEFILTYHSSLRSSVPPEVPIPSMADLRKDLKDKCVYGYFLCCFFLPWMMEEHPRPEVNQWIHHGGRDGTEAIANILRFLIDRDLV